MLMMANNNNNGLTKIAPNSNGTAQYTNYNTLIAWGIPALQTVAVLVARFVDADELLGELREGLLTLSTIVLFRGS